jgi:hypothetical protein
VWTPLGKNQLRIDNEAGQALPLEILSRGTRETVFIALRLSLAAAYARRGVMLPLVLDDVFVNFDRARTAAAAQVLRDFAALGHQVIMFTCHEHIMRIFHDIGVQVRMLPPQGQPGEANIYVMEQPVVPQPVIIEAPPATVVVAAPPAPPVPTPAVAVAPEPTPEPLPIMPLTPEPSINWMWYEDDFDPEDPINNMAARADALEHSSDEQEMSGWIEAVESPSEPPADPESYPLVDDLWWQRPISA